MSKLIIIRGNSGSGKTTAARTLQRRLGRNTMLISQDAVRREMLLETDGPQTKAIPLLTELVRYGREHSPYVILEGILVAEWYEPLFRAALEQFGKDIHAYYYDIPFEETLRRHSTRDKRAEFGESEMRSWWKERDYIGFIPERPITPDLSLDDAVELIYRDAVR